MRVERIAIAECTPDPANARKHDDKNLAAIKGSLVKFGQQTPIVVDAKGIVLKGNGTLAAARSLGWETIDVVRTELVGVDAAGYALADNRSGELAAWDDDALSKTLAALQADGYALDMIGFDDADLAKWLEPPAREPGLTDDDAVPEQAPPRAEFGDVWVCGNHRVMCGDSTDAEHVARLMAGEKADMVFTDPPYGMALDADYKRKGAGAGIYAGKDMGRSQGVTHREVRGDHDDFTPELINTVFARYPDCAEIFLWGADYYSEHIPERKDGSWIVWDKVTKADGEQSGVEKFHGSNFELCWSKAKHKRDLARVMHKGLASVENEKRHHPTQKPVALAEWFFERWGKPSDLVADLFLGSGSTLIACEKTGRRCYGMEIDRHYVDVIVERWQKYTGKTAILETP